MAYNTTMVNKHKKRAPETDEGDGGFTRKYVKLNSASDWRGIVTLVTDALPGMEYDIDKAVLHGARGDAHLKLNDTASAIADFTRALELSAENSASHYVSRATAYYQQGDCDSALADATREEVADDMGAAYIRGVAYHAKGEHDLAIADLTRSIESDPGIAEAYYHRGGSYMAKDECARALADLNKAVELAPDKAMMHVMRACVYRRQGNGAKALADARRAAQLEPGNKEARETLRVIRSENQGRASATTAMPPEDDAPEDEIPDALRGRLSKLSGAQGEGWADISERASAILSGPDIDPDTGIDKAKVHYIRAYSLLQQGEVEDAIAGFTRALELNPDDEYALTFRGVAHHQQGARAAALADFNKALELKPDYADAYYHRAASHSDNGFYDNAVADLSKALELSPDNVMAYTLRGYALSMQGKHRIGLADLNQALRLDPDNTEAREMRRFIRQRAKGRM